MEYSVRKQYKQQSSSNLSEILAATNRTNAYAGSSNLDKAPQKIERTDKPQDRVIGNHDIRTTGGELGDARPRQRGEVSDKEGRRDD